MSERAVTTRVEDLRLKEGLHAYLLKDERGDPYKEADKKRMTHEEVLAEMESEATFIGSVRKQIENQGGKFNGIQSIEVDIPDPDYLGSAFPHRLTFVFAEL